jgi:2-succinyl-6-hydroxy-2,4-cyclohexadiene-1-carboxylate synthase
VHVVGYSMGGRVALSLAAAHPSRLRSLLLVGASPGLADPEARAARVEADEALARQIEERGLSHFVDYWMDLPLFASQAKLGDAFRARVRAQRLRCDPGGLARSLRGMGSGAMPPLHDRLPEVSLPVCLVAGSQDGKFVALAESMRYALPDARCALVEGAGHAAHLEDAEQFARIARGFLAECDPAPPLV